MAALTVDERDGDLDLFSGQEKEVGLGGSIFDRERGERFGLKLGD